MKIYAVKNEDYKVKVITENYNAADQGIPLREYVVNESENDPNFWRWLFDADFDECPEELEYIWEDFVNDNF